MTPTDPQGAEGPSERYERMAEQFHAETGLMAPGKDVPYAVAFDDYEERVAAWRAFLTRYPIAPHAGEETRG